MDAIDHAEFIPEYRDDGIFFGNIPIMYTYEKEYVKLAVKFLCEKFKPKTVVDVGFGHGTTAGEWKKNGVERAIIIESNQNLAEQARQAGHEVIEGRIQEVEIPGHIDLIHDDRFETVTPDEEPDWSRFDYDNLVRYFEKEKALYQRVGDKGKLLARFYEDGK